MKTLAGLLLALFSTGALALVPSPVVKARCDETSTTTSAPTPTPAACEGATKFKYFGVNQAGAEFGNNVIPVCRGHFTKWTTSLTRTLLTTGLPRNPLHLAGTQVRNRLCTDEDQIHTDSPISSIDFFVKEGFNTFRVPFQQERLSPPETGIAGPFDEAYLGDLKKAGFDLYPYAQFLNLLRL